MTLPASIAAPESLVAGRRVDRRGTTVDAGHADTYLAQLPP
ncbi:hypothetical protein [Xanthomonas campestris]|uniref:Uncharacterized protein n=1 Tax=Xanthomonas campestris pv. papavericola TaxID=487881 RepID=A0AAJ2X1E8_XANCA|nr:hypothetical protein [Xanthomonas campestris]MEC3887136.1 hypothetical protein [Xanthomonas campestris pv. papavericola]